MKRELVLLSAAESDLREIAIYIMLEAGDAAVGEHFVDRLIERCERLALLSGMLGTPRPELGPDLRSFAYGSYIVFFRYSGDTMEVVNVLHASRDLFAAFEIKADD